MHDPSPEALRRLLDDVARLATDYAGGIDARPIQPATTAAELERRLGGLPPEHGAGEAVVERLREVIDGVRTQNGRFFGYVMGSGEPVGAVADLLASVLNQNLTAWRSSPAGVTVERAVVRWLAEAIGCPGFGGSLTGGGSSANLMGLAMAREARTPANAQGVRGGVVYASEQAHMSIGKAVALLGLGRDNLRLLPTDGALRLRVDLLEAAIARDEAEGRTPVAIVSCAGTVATGAIDPLAEIADVAAYVDAHRQDRKLLDDPLFEIASHTYSHRMLRNNVFCGAAPSMDERRIEIVKGKETIERVFERPCLGLRPGCGFDNALRGEPEVLKIIQQAGYRYVSSLLWGPDYSLPALLEDPFEYSADGFPGLWELPGHGWHENLLKDHNQWGPKRLTLWPSPFPEAIPDGFCKTPQDEFCVNKVFLDKAADAGKIFVSLIWHPWSLAKFDPEMKMLELTFKRVRELGLIPSTYARLRDSLPLKLI